jgi:hypothetical protein
MEVMTSFQIGILILSGQLVVISIQLLLIHGRLSDIKDSKSHDKSTP